MEISTYVKCSHDIYTGGQKSCRSESYFVVSIDSNHDNELKLIPVCGLNEMYYNIKSREAERCSHVAGVRLRCAAEAHLSHFTCELKHVHKTFGHSSFSFTLTCLGSTLRPQEGLEFAL